MLFAQARRKSRENGVAGWETVLPDGTLGYGCGHPSCLLTPLTQPSPFPHRTSIYLMDLATSQIPSTSVACQQSLGGPCHPSMRPAVVFREPCIRNIKAATTALPGTQGHFLKLLVLSRAICLQTC